MSTRRSRGDVESEESRASQKIQPSADPLPMMYGSLQGDQRRSNDPLHRQDVGRNGALAGGRGGRRRRLAVDQFLELFAWLEVRDLLWRHVDLVAGLGVSSLSRLALP